MQLIPDWAPNIHPMIVHFPLVLLIFAVLFDVAGLFLKKFNWLANVALLLYLFGTISAAVAFLTGNLASDGLEIPATIIPAVNEHADWAEITLWFFVIYSVVRLTIGIWFKSLKLNIAIPFVLAGLLGIYFLYQTADHGAKLVFGYGLGTGNILKVDVEKTEENKSSEQIPDSTFTVSKNGSWKLIAATGVVSILKEKFSWIESSIENVAPMYDEENSALMFHLQKEVPTLAGFVYDNKMKSVQVTAKINIDDFNGELELVHHLIDKNNYDFLGLKKGEVSLSRKTNGEIKIFEKDNFQNKGWIEIKVVSDGTHFRGYVNNKLMLHGHDSEPEAGSVGMRIFGSGSVSLKSINAESLRN